MAAERGDPEMATERMMKGPTFYTYSRDDIIRSPEEMAAEKRVKGSSEEMAAEKRVKGRTCNCCCDCDCDCDTTWTEFFSDPFVWLKILALLAYVAVALSVVEPCLENLGPILFLIFVQVPMFAMLSMLG